MLLCQALFDYDYIIQKLQIYMLCSSSPLSLVKRTKQQQKTNIRLQYEQMMRFVAPLLGDDDRKVIELFGKRQTDRRKDGQTILSLARNDKKK